MIAADVNGDGKVDLISANSEDDTLTVLTNDCSGGFEVASTPSVGSHPFALVAADIYGNGIPVLIDADERDNTLTVLTNTGGGIFVSNMSYAVGSEPRSVAVADVNNDGKLDLICANYGDGSLTVFTNNGSGGFVLASTISVGSGPYSVVAADVNGDGKVDLVSANSGDDTLTVLTNSGGGKFVLSSVVDLDTANVPTPTTPQSVFAAGVNGDGKVDLITANSGDDTLSVLTNNGSGGFMLDTNVDISADGTPFSVIAADVSGDGALDLIRADNNGFVSVLFSVPTIRTNPVSGGIVLAWPTNNTDGFVLQQNSNLATTNWVNVTNAQTTVIGQNEVVDSLRNTNRFYRLRHP